MEWFEWGVKHYFLGDEAEDDDEEEDQAYNEQQDYYAEYDYENQDGEKNSEYVEENTEYLFTACRNGTEELKNGTLGARKCERYEQRQQNFTHDCKPK